MMVGLGFGPPMGGVGFDLFGADSALTRSRVWKVETSGRFSWCLMTWPATPLSQ